MAAEGKARREGIRDARLVQAAREGDPRAFELLYERHHAAILSFCRHLTGRLEDAEDAVQHTFLSAHRELTGSTRALDLKQWLFTVARNRCLSLLRARRLREGPDAGALRTGRHAPPEERADEAWGSEGLTVEVERREELRALVADLGQLPEPQRAALVLSELEALSHAQVAQVLDVDAAKVRSLVFQARSSLISTREARNTACGEIRVQLSTLRGSSLRRRTLRRHVRSCAGCREFEAAVRVQRRDIAAILPVTASAGLRDAALSSLLGGGAAGGAAAAGGGAVVGGAALAGGGAAVGGASGVFGGLAGAVAGSGVAQLTAVVAVVVTGSVGLAKAEIPQRLGIVQGGQRAAPVASDPSNVGPRGETRLADGAGPADDGSTANRPAGDSPPGDGSAPRSDGAPAGGRNGDGDGRADAPGQSKKGAGETGVPPGQAKQGDGVTPPGLARRSDGGVGPGQAKKGDGGAPPGQAKRPAKPTPPGQGKPPAGGQPSSPGGPAPKGPAKPLPPGQSKPAPPGQSKDPAPTAAPGQGAEPAKPAPPGQSKEPKPK